MHTSQKKNLTRFASSFVGIRAGMSSHSLEPADIVIDDRGDFFDND